MKKIVLALFLLCCSTLYAEEVETDLSQLNLGTHISGYEADTDELHGKVVVVESWGIT